MVNERIFSFFICGFILFLTCVGAEPAIESSIDAANSRAHFPLQGTITITRDKSDNVDPSSFTLNGKSLDVSFVKEVKMSPYSETVLSIYTFQQPAQEKGNYILPAVSVRINGKIYKSVSSPYEVQEPSSSVVKSVSTPTSTQSEIPLIFRLEAFVDGPKILYPGSRTKLVYRISYNRSIDLSRSDLPMIHPAHLQKIGDVKIEDSQNGDTTLQVLTQEVEASSIGTFSFGPSLIEGYAYSIQNGKKIYDSDLLKAEAPVVVLEVKPFPQAIVPNSFSGGLGKITIDGHLTTSSHVSVGDTMRLEVKIQGISNLGEFQMPPLQCQPGFSGFFQTNDFAPLAEVKEGVKHFYLDMRPLNSMINQIPSIEVSSLDAKTGKYIVSKTEPIPITVSAHVEEMPIDHAVPRLVEYALPGSWPAPSLPELEMSDGFSEQGHGIFVSWLETDRVLWLMPVALILLLLQIYWKRERDKYPRPSPPKSELLFARAIQLKSLQLLEVAFWNWLWEKGEVKPGSMQLDALPTEGKFAPIRSFIFQLEDWQYGRERNVDFNYVVNLFLIHKSENREVREASDENAKKV